MSDKDPKKDASAAPVAPRPGISPVGLVLPAVLAAAASFGGARVAGARTVAPAPAEAHAPHIEPPGPTLSLEPFLVMATDAGHHSHPMRVTLAVEFAQSVHEETTRAFVPRIRDAALNYIRGMSYEDATDSARMDHIRAELLERFRVTGAVGAERVLVTDLVIQ